MHLPNHSGRSFRRAFLRLVLIPGFALGATGCGESQKLLSKTAELSREHSKLAAEIDAMAAERTQLMQRIQLIKDHLHLARNETMDGAAAKIQALEVKLANE